MTRRRVGSRTKLATGAAALALVAAPAAALAGLPNAIIGAGNVQGVTVLQNGHGLTLYLRTTDPRGHSSCYGSCLAGWTPVLTGGKAVVRQGSGVNARLLGTTRRRNGKLQVTYNHRPLYTYNADSMRGDDNGEACASDPAGQWFMVSKRGKAVKGVVGGCQGY